MAFSNNNFTNVPEGNSSHLPTVPSGALKNRNSPAGGRLVVYTVEKAPYRFQDAFRVLGRVKKSSHQLRTENHDSF